MDELWPVSGERASETDPLRECLAKETGLAESADHYAEAVTAFYTRYPHDRDISIEEVVEQFAKGLTVEQVHAYPFWRHDQATGKQ
jgi:hypothetical protein